MAYHFLMMGKEDLWRGDIEFWWKGKKEPASQSTGQKHFRQRRFCSALRKDRRQVWLECSGQNRVGWHQVKTAQQYGSCILSWAEVIGRVKQENHTADLLFKKNSLATGWRMDWVFSFRSRECRLEATVVVQTHKKNEAWATTARQWEVDEFGIYFRSTTGFLLY